MAHISYSSYKGNMAATAYSILASLLCGLGALGIITAIFQHSIPAKIVFVSVIILIIGIILKLNEEYVVSVTDPYLIGMAKYREKDYKAAVKKFRQGADAGRDDCRYMAAVMLEAGVGCKRDIEKAQKYLRPLTLDKDYSLYSKAVPLFNRIAYELDPHAELINDQDEALKKELIKTSKTVMNATDDRTRVNSEPVKKPSKIRSFFTRRDVKCIILIYAVIIVMVLISVHNAYRNENRQKREKSAVDYVMASETADSTYSLTIDLDKQTESKEHQNEQLLRPNQPFSYIEKSSPDAATYKLPIYTDSEFRSPSLGIIFYPLDWTMYDTSALADFDHAQSKIYDVGLYEDVESGERFRTEMYAYGKGYESVSLRILKVGDGYSEEEMLKEISENSKFGLLNLQDNMIIDNITFDQGPYTFLGHNAIIYTVDIQFKDQTMSMAEVYFIHDGFVGEIKATGKNENSAVSIINNHFNLIR